MSTVKRFARFFAYFVLGVLAGALAAFSAGFFGVFFDQYQKTGFPYFLTTDFLVQLSEWAVMALVGLTLVLAYLSSRAHQQSLALEDSDEEKSYLAYRTAFRRLEYANITHNIAAGFLIFSLVIGVRQMTEETILRGFSFPIVSFVLVVISQIVVLRLTRKLRNYKISVFPTIKETKEMLLHYDEGELQANYEQSFETLFALTQYVIPGLFVILMLVALVSPLSAVSGFVILLIIHVYLQLANLKMIRRYFK